MQQNSSKNTGQDLSADMTTLAAMASQSKQEKRTERRATWYNFQKVKLIKTLSELNSPEYWARNGWNEKAWEIVQKRMDCGYCFNYSIKQIKNQEKALKKQYDTVKKLIWLNGFHWDQSHGKVVAQDDLWKQLFESEKHAEQWRRMQFPLYEELCKLYEGTNTKKNCCQCSNLASKQSSMCSYAPPPNMNAQSVSSYEESSDTDDCEAEILKMLLLEEITSQIMMENNMLSMLPGKEAEKPQKDSLEKKYSISECMKALNGSSGFTQDERFKAADFLKGRIHHDFLPKMSEWITGFEKFI